MCAYGPGNTFDRWNVFADATTAVTDKFTSLGTIATNGYTKAAAALAALDTIVAELVALGIAITVTPVTVDTPDLAAAVSAMDETDFVVTTPTAPATISITDVTASLSSAPTAPLLSGQTLATSEISSGNETYSDNLLAALKNWLLNQITTGAVGITAAVEDAIFNRESERSILEQRDLEDSIAAEWSGRGWPLPNGALVAGINQSKINYTNKRLDMSRDVAIKSFELALANTHFVLQQTIAIEAHLIALANWVAERAFQVSRAVVVDKEIGSYRARLENDSTLVKKYDSDVNSYSATTRAQIDSARVSIENNLHQIRKFESDINLYAAQMKVEGERIDAVAKGYNSIDTYKVQRYALNLQAIKARIDQAVANTGLLIQDKGVEIKQYEAINALMVQAKTAIGQVGASLLHGALSSVHVSAQIHASDSASYGYKGPASLSELIDPP